MVWMWYICRALHDFFHTFPSCSLCEKSAGLFYSLMSVFWARKYVMSWLMENKWHSSPCILIFWKIAMYILYALYIIATVSYMGRHDGNNNLICLTTSKCWILHKIMIVDGRWEFCSLPTTFETYIENFRYILKNYNSFDVPICSMELIQMLYLTQYWPGTSLVDTLQIIIFLYCHIDWFTSSRLHRYNYYSRREMPWHKLPKNWPKIGQTWKTTRTGRNRNLI